MFIYLLILSVLLGAFGAFLAWLATKEMNYLKEMHPNSYFDLVGYKYSRWAEVAAGVLIAVSILISIAVVIFSP